MSGARGNVSGHGSTRYRRSIGAATAVRALLTTASVILGSNGWSPAAAADPEPLSIERIRSMLDVSGIEFSDDDARAVGSRLTELIERDPNDVAALVEMSRFQLMQGYMRTNREEGAEYRPIFLEAARSMIERAIAVAPEHADAYIPYGNYFEGERQYQQAVEQFAKAKQLGSRNPWLFERWGRVLALMGDHDAAATRFKQGLELADENRYARGAILERLGMYHEQRGEYDIADGYFRQQTEAFPANAWVHGTYSEFLRERMRDYDGAVAFGEKALELANYGVGRRILAMAYLAKWAHEREDQPEQDDGLLDRARALYPDTAQLFVWMASEAHNAPLVRPMVEGGIKIESVNDAGYTALHYAAGTGETAAAILLLELGADPTMTGDDRTTPIFHAGLLGDVELTKALLARLPTGPSKMIEQAISVARHKGNTNVEALLIEHYMTGVTTGTSPAE